MRCSARPRDGLTGILEGARIDPDATSTDLDPQPGLFAKVLRDLCPASTSVWHHGLLEMGPPKRGGPTRARPMLIAVTQRISISGGDDAGDPRHRPSRDRLSCIPYN